MASTNLPDCDTDKLFEELFLNMDAAFFKSIRTYTDRKKRIQQKIANVSCQYCRSDIPLV